MMQSLKGRILPSSAEDGSSFPAEYSLESYLHQQPLSPPENYPVPETGNADHGTYSYNYRSLSVEEKNDVLVTTKNSLELLSSILNAETEPKPIKVICFSFRRVIYKYN